MPRFDVDGLGLHAEVAGSGPPLVLLHGFTGSAGTWGISRPRSPPSTP